MPTNSSTEKNYQSKNFSEVKIQLPSVAIADTEQAAGYLLRRDLLDNKEQHRHSRASAARELRYATNQHERDDLHANIRHEARQEQDIKRILTDRFVPQHSDSQLLGARALFASPLFHVRSKSSPRREHVELLLTPPDMEPLRYEGPELRQSDARVFLALVHMLRDIRSGVCASFHVRELCQALFGRYDGDSRRQLRESIQRLQRGLLVFSCFSVQMLQRFDFPSHGPWSVSLDPQVAKLFEHTPKVWLQLQQRLALPDGLTTWLYAYVESQRRLIPMQLDTLRALCGAESSGRAFANRLRIALGHLAEAGLIDAGWSLRSDLVRWRKPLPMVNE